MIGNRIGTPEIDYISWVETGKHLSFLNGRRVIKGIFKILKGQSKGINKNASVKKHHPKCICQNVLAKMHQSKNIRQKASAKKHQPKCIIEKALLNFEKSGLTPAKEVKLEHVFGDVRPKHLNQ